MALRDMGTRAGSIVNVDPKIIKVKPGHNARLFDSAEAHEKLVTLSESIAVNGVIKPLEVSFDAGTVYLVDGERRLRAALMAIENGSPIAAVPCISVNTKDEQELTMRMLVSNTGEPLTQWEAGTGYKRLVAFGWDKPRIARECNVTLNYVTRAIELAEAPEGVKALLSAGSVTPAIAAQAVKQHGSKAAAVLTSAVQANGGAPVKRERVTSDADVLKVVRKLLAEVTEPEWEEFYKGEFENISVSGSLLSQLRSIVTNLDSQPAATRIKTTITIDDVPFTM